MKGRLRLIGALLLGLISAGAPEGRCEDRAGATWTRREVPLGAASSLVKWCGKTSDRVVVFTARGMALVDLPDGHVRVVARSPLSPGSVSCSQDGRHLFWTSAQRTDLRMVDTRSLEETIVHRTPEGPRRRFVAPTGSITAKVSPGLNFIVGYRGAASTIPSPSGKAMKVIEFDDLDASLIAQRGVWSDDERYLFWPTISQKEIRMYDAQTRRLVRRRMFVEGYYPWWISAVPNSARELYVFFMSENETMGVEYKIDLSKPETPPQLVVNDLSSYGPESVSATGDFVFVRNYFDSSKPGFEKESRLALPIASKLFVLAGGVEQPISSIGPENQNALPAISADGRRIVYVRRNSMGLGHAESALVIFEKTVGK